MDDVPLVFQVDNPPPPPAIAHNTPLSKETLSVLRLVKSVLRLVKLF